MHLGRQRPAGRRGGHPLTGTNPLRFAAFRTIESLTTSVTKPMVASVAPSGVRIQSCSTPKRLPNAETA